MVKVTTIPESKPSVGQKVSCAIFGKLPPILRGQGDRGGSYDQKNFPPKFVQRDVLGTCKVWGASEKPFRQFKFQT